MNNLYKIEFKKKARKFIENQSKEDRIRIINAIRKLPYGDVKKLQNNKGYYRLRVGDIRVIFEKKQDIFIIIIIDIGNRGQIYNKY